MTSLSALRAPGLLREFEQAGVLAVADIQVATRLGALVGETDDRVLLAVALTRARHPSGFGGAGPGGRSEFDHRRC